MWLSGGRLAARGTSFVCQGLWSWVCLTLFLPNDAHPKPPDMTHWDDTYTACWYACFTQSMRRTFILFVWGLIVSSRWRQEQAFFRWVKTFFWTNCGWRGRRTTPAAQLSCLISCISSNLTLIDFVIELSTISLIPFSLLWLDLARLPMLDQQQQLHFFQSSQQDHHQVVK